MRVIDASAALKCVFNEEGSDEARRIMIEEVLAAPAFIDIEAANALRSRNARRELDEDETLQSLAAFRRLPVRRVADDGLLALALRLGMELTHPIYDCLYLALALETGADLVTADEKFARVMLKGGHGGRLRLIGPDHP